MKTLTTLCAIGALSLSCPAAADSTLVRHQRHAAVYAADLDLAREADVRTLYERIAYAARVICTPRDLPFAAPEKRHRHTCVRSAVARAVKRVGAPLLTVIHRERAER